eukprot:354593_1
MSVETAYFPIKGSDLAQFLKTNSAQCFASKSLSINNIHFQVYIYPNGTDKKNIGYVQFVVVPSKFDSNIKSVTVCCKLYCPVFQVMFKEVITLNKSSDNIQWSNYALPLSECEHIITHNRTDHLDFICDLEMLKIKDKSNKYNSGIKQRLSIRKQSGLPISAFQPRTLTLKTHTNIEWNITNQMIALFKHIINGKSFYSQDINNMWCLCVYSNGNHFELALKLLYLPPEIKTIAVDFSIQKNKSVEKLVQKRNILFNYKKTQETATLFKVSDLMKWCSSKVSISVKVKKIFQVVKGKNAIGEEVKGSFSKYGFTDFPPGQFQFNIDYGKDKIKYGQTDKSSYYSMDDTKYSHTPITDVTENLSDSRSKEPSISSFTVPTTSLITGHTHSSSLFLHNIKEDKQELPRKSITAFSGNDQSVSIPLANIIEDIKPWSDQKTNEMNIKSERNMFTMKVNNNNFLNELHEQCDDINDQNIPNNNT